MSQLPLTLVCFAVKEEARPFQRAVTGREEVRIMLTGMGPRNAERTVRQALNLECPSLVFSAGFAGGLNPELKVGDVIFSAEGEPELATRLAAAGAKPGRFLFVNKVASTAEVKRTLRQATSADAVEMESQIICGLCRERGISCATVRVILDTATEDLPLDFNQFMTPDQRLAGGRLARALLKSPAKIGALLRLQKQCEVAAKRLAEVLEGAIPEKRK